MKWIHDYQLFLFDFDGILANTEKLHFKAYQKMCKDRGFSLWWDEKTYLRHAMYSSDGLKNAFFKEFPELLKEASWETLYLEKKKAYKEFLKEGVELIPGVDKLLASLEKAKIKRCVVTHSSKEQVDLIRRQQPALNSIPFWITREDYNEPKPASECYLKAISKLGSPHDRIIGFEDSPRGLKALLGAHAEGVLITSLFTEQEVKGLANGLESPFEHFSSFFELYERKEG